MAGTIITAAVNNINIVNGTASLDVAAGVAVDANANLTVSNATTLTGSPYTPSGTDVAVADGGTGASTAAAAATNLGLGTTDGPTFAHAHLTDAIADNLSTNQAATTEFVGKQLAVLARDPDQGVAFQAGAWAAMKVTHSATFSATTNSGGYGGVFACPSYTPAATQILLNKWAANVGYKLELILTSGIFRLTLNATTYDSTVPGGGAASNLLAGSKHSILATPTIGASTTTVAFELDGVLLNTTAAQANVDVTNTQDLYIGGTSAVTYAMTVYDVYHLNLAPSATEWRLAYLEGIPESWKWGSQTSLVTGNDSTFSGASNWYNTDINSYDETTGGVLTITASAYGQFCRLPAANAPMINGKKYRLVYASSNLTGTWGVYEVGGDVLLTTISATGAISVEFTFTDPYSSGGGFRLHSNQNNSSVQLDNVLLYELGATFALTPESWQPDKPYDLSTNNAVCAYPASGWALTRPPAESPMQPTPTDGSTGAVTVTIAMILNGIITGNPSAARAYTFETGATSDAWPSLQIDRGYEWSVINLNATYAITITAASGHTIVGDAVVALSTTGRFLTRKTAASTFVTYRIA
jgi:hypothetical protein